jgi:tetratricopeptide (TPR) repeat protein
MRGAVTPYALGQAGLEGHGMQKDVANRKFDRAQLLFEQKRYAEALRLLGELEAAFPDNRRVLYPRALCLAKMRHYEEARALCVRLVDEHDDARGAKLLERIEERLRRPVRKPESEAKSDTFAGFSIAPPPSHGSDPLGLDAMFARSQTPAPAPAPQRSAAGLVVAIAVGAVLGAVALYLVMQAAGD